LNDLTMHVKFQKMKNNTAALFVTADFIERWINTYNVKVCL